MTEILDISRKILEDYCLCDNCLGRQFASLSYGISNAERGKNVKNTLALIAHSMFIEGNKEGLKILKNLSLNGMSKTAANTLMKLGVGVSKERKECNLCKGKFQQIDRIVDQAVKEASEYEFNTFLIGAKIPEEIMEAEDALRSKYGIKWGETIKSEFTRETGKIFSEKTGKEVEYKKPDLTITIHPFEGRVDVQVNPLFIGGRYQKLVTGIPQSKWICIKCEGKGCELCSGTGKKYPESVQEIIATPILTASKGVNTEFHAAGREDIDARVVGNGRPFILEVKMPKRRSLDLKKIRDEINKSGKIEVNELKYVTRDDIRKLKTKEAVEKTYLAIIEADDKITAEDLKKIEKTFTNCKINQATPKRVLHRRADKIREKYIYETKARRLAPNKLELTIQCQGGLYVKELISGDQGRTVPSIAEIIRKNVKCIELTVLNVKAES
jgi:tRNA pseudouridine synthase 10